MKGRFNKRSIFVSILILIFAAFHMRPLVAQSGQDLHVGHDHAEELHEAESSDKREKHDEHEHHMERTGSEENATNRAENDGHDHEGHEDEHGEGSIQLDSEAQEMIQLKTEKAAMRALKAHLKVYGKIARDTENSAYITYAGEGIVDTIKVSLGEIVDEGAPLLSIRKNDGSVDQVISDRHGTVFSIFVKPSERIDQMTSLLSLVNVDTLRATIDVYEKDLRLIEIGQKVVLTTFAFPEKKFHGEVVYISPQIDEHTQAIQVRVDVANQDHLLRLGMFVEGELIYSSDNKVLAIRNSAIQQIGGEEVVFLQEEPGHYVRRDVILGRGAGGFTEVTQGLKDGDVVVTQGSFYLKSEIEKESFSDGHNH